VYLCCFYLESRAGLGVMSFVASLGITESTRPTHRVRRTRTTESCLSPKYEGSEAYGRLRAVGE